METATIIDIMEWMINTQLGRRNLPPAQRLAVVEKFKKKIQEEAKEKYDATVGRPSKENRSPNGEQLNNKFTQTKNLQNLQVLELERWQDLIG